MKVMICRLVLVLSQTLGTATGMRAVTASESQLPAARLGR
jgi:hypothetical protein